MPGVDPVIGSSAHDRVTMCADEDGHARVAVASPSCSRRLSQELLAAIRRVCLGSAVVVDFEERIPDRRVGPGDTEPSLLLRALRHLVCDLHLARRDGDPKHLQLGNRANSIDAEPARVTYDDALTAEPADEQLRGLEAPRPIHP
jgi:hypothetical protein